MVTVSGITTSVKLSQPAKAVFPIVLTDSGKENSSIPVPANALSPIDVIDSGKESSVIPVPANALFPIVFTPDNKVIFLRLSIPLQNSSGILGVPLNAISDVFCF